MRTAEKTAAVRRYPQIRSDLPPPSRPISFICIKFSDEYQHNFRASECVHNPLNQLIVVDNTNNHRFVTLGAAMNAGIEQAAHDIVAIVHEDVLLLPGWQSMFQASLAALEDQDPHWLVAGVVGWAADGALKGHFSDPHQTADTLKGAAFAEVEHIDEQVVILRRSGGLMPDSELPSIHNIGLDLPRQAAERNVKTYVLNAPSIHKFADADGKKILRPDDSIKIQRRQGLQFRADRHCSDEYYRHKWGLDERPAPRPDDLPETLRAILNAPVLLLGRGGSGTRLLSVMARDLGVFIGNDVNETGDSREMALSIYRVLVRKYRCPSVWHLGLIEDDLRSSARDMLEQAGWPAHWGFKLPEALFALPELEASFPNARYVFLDRDTLDIAVQRPHLTARPGRIAGQIALALAYDETGIGRERMLEDDDLARMAVTAEHQSFVVRNWKERLPAERWCEIGFQDLLGDPDGQLDRLAAFFGMEVRTSNICSVVDAGRGRAANPNSIRARLARLLLERAKRALANERRSHLEHFIGRLKMWHALKAYRRAEGAPEAQHE